jgi:ribose 5-phosphate isomerase RpiB
MTARPRRLSRLWLQTGDSRSRSGDAERGVALCGSGIGISIAVNRNPGLPLRAGIRTPVAALAREHNDANVIAWARA